MQKTLLLLALSTTIMISCKKDNKNITPTHVPCSETIADYGKLAVGNYWIYQRYKITNSGIITPLNIYDSCYISKDTIINGKTYFEMYRPNTYGSFYSYVRDSSAWILDHYGRIQFSPTDFSTIFRTTHATAGGTDTICRAIFKMNNKDSLITTPAGVFNTSNFQTTCFMYPTWSHYYNVRFMNTCYSENIGIVVETLYLLLDKGFCVERKLVRYHLN
jgi:hypothetical protein